MAAIVRLAFCLYRCGASRGISWLPWPRVVSAGGLLPVFVWFTSFFSLTLTLSPEQRAHRFSLFLQVASDHCRNLDFSFRNDFVFRIGLQFMGLYHNEWAEALGIEISSPRAKDGTMVVNRTSLSSGKLMPSLSFKLWEAEAVVASMDHHDSSRRSECLIRDDSDSEVVFMATPTSPRVSSSPKCELDAAAVKLQKKCPLDKDDEYPLLSKPEAQANAAVSNGTDGAEHNTASAATDEHTSDSDVADGDVHRTTVDGNMSEAEEDDTDTHAHTDVDTEEEKCVGQLPWILKLNEYGDSIKEGGSICRLFPKEWGHIAVI
ncbi:unnamed protein product [Miscanthus lutarioriparius]|uniref:Uncharacterized protein n=1 Tax=Miscanthus lutarioriparius TaxID=422564 RepID=A0A811RSB3_9POAL|nr:unnamed protein product [Miscanthus lutarioriparius]